MSEVRTVWMDGHRQRVRIVICSECGKEKRTAAAHRPRLTCSAKCGRVRDKRLARERELSRAIRDMQRLARWTSEATERVLRLGGFDGRALAELRGANDAA